MTVHCQGDATDLAEYPRSLCIPSERFLRQREPGIDITDASVDKRTELAYFGRARAPQQRID